MTANWTVTRSSEVRIKAADLAASRTRISCDPPTGLLEGHFATCRAQTFDMYDNPQIGAVSSNFVVTYLSNPATFLGSTDGGLMQPTEREDTFEARFQAVDEGTAGIMVAVNFADHLPSSAAAALKASTVLGTIQVKRSELVLFPSSAVMRYAVPFTVGLDATGAAHDYVVLRFIPGGQQLAGRDGGCTSARVDGELGFSVDTSAGSVGVSYTFQEPGDYGVCYVVNATTRPPGSATSRALARVGLVPSRAIPWHASQISSSRWARS